MSEDSENEKGYSWVDKPSQTHKARSVFGLVIIILTAVVIFWASDNNFFFGFIALVLMFYASGRFYFPTNYYADEIGIGEKFLGYSRTRKWGEFKRVDIGENAVFLSPYEKKRRMDSFRGLFVPVPDDKTKEFILNEVYKRIGEKEEE